MSHEAGAGFQSLLTLLGCLIPIAICLYLVDIEPLVSVGDVEFTQPDVVLIIIALVVIVRAAFKGFHSLQKSFFFPLFLVLLSTIASAFNASDRLRAAAAVLQVLEFGLLAWCFSLVTTPKYFLRVLHAILGVFVFETLVAAGQFADGMLYPTGTFAAHQEYAFYTSYSAAVAFALWVNEKRSFRKRLYLVILGILLFGSLLGQERAPWLGFIVAGFVVTWYAGKHRKRLLMGFAVTILSAIILVVSIPQLRDVTIARFAEAESDSEQSNSLLSRLALWAVAYQLFLEHPILGVGPKNFVTLVPHYLSVEEMMGSDKMDPHNVWIGVLAEQGIVGLLAYVYFAVTVIRIGVRVLRQNSVPIIRSVGFAYLAYHIFWFTMSYHYFAKNTGHTHFMIIGMMLGLQRGISVPASPEKSALQARIG